MYCMSETHCFYFFQSLFFCSGFPPHVQFNCDYIVIIFPSTRWMGFPCVFNKPSHYHIWTDDLFVIDPPMMTAVTTEACQVPELPAVISFADYLNPQASPSAAFGDVGENAKWVYCLVWQLMWKLQLGTFSAWHRLRFQIVTKMGHGHPEDGDVMYDSHL